MKSRLRDLESQLLWCWDWYVLRVWQEFGSFNSASEFDRLQIAKEMRGDTEGRSKEWASLGLTNLLDHLISKLDGSDAEVRQDAAIEIGEHCPKDHRAVNILIERLQSPDQTLHDRACAAWALGNIGAKAGDVVPILLALIEVLKDQVESHELRYCTAEAIEKLTEDIQVLTMVAQHGLRDGFWKCRMNGMFRVERLLKRQPDLASIFVPLIEPLLMDELEEIQEIARRLLERCLGIV